MGSLIGLKLGVEPTWARGMAVGKLSLSSSPGGLSVGGEAVSAGASSITIFFSRDGDLRFLGLLAFELLC